MPCSPAIPCAARIPVPVIHLQGVRRIAVTASRFAAVMDIVQHVAVNLQAVAACR